MDNCKILALSLAFSELGIATKNLKDSFNGLNEAEKAFKENQPLEKTPSKYINKPRYNFKRR